MKKSIELCGRTVEYDLQRKNVKNINIRIKPGGIISVSAAPRVPIRAIEELMRSNGEYIVKTVDRYRKKAEDAPPPPEYSDGEKITVIGEEYTLSVREGERCSAAIHDDILVLTVKNTSDRELRRKTTEAFLMEICRERVNELCERVYPEFREWLDQYPVIKFRKMKTRWGICRPGRKEITFSYMLASAPVECIEYVVFHEFCHFAWPDHSKNFYSLLSGFLPDWKARKSKLDSCADLN